MFVFNYCTGTGSEVKTSKKHERPGSSWAQNHGIREYKHTANHNKTGADRKQSSTNIPALGDGKMSPSSVNSQGNHNVLTNCQSTPQDGVDILHKGQNKDWDSAKPSVQSSNSPSSHQRMDKNSTLTSPHKHREKRKHCESANLKKHKKRKHSKDARFEGQRISHLVKKRTFKKEDPETDGQKKSDDYVLAKLFKKSGRICALKPHFV